MYVEMPALFIVRDLQRIEPSFPVPSEAPVAEFCEESSEFVYVKWCDVWYVFDGQTDVLWLAYGLDPPLDL